MRKYLLMLLILGLLVFATGCDTELGHSHEDHDHDNDGKVRHYTPEDIHQFDGFAQHPFEVIGGHGHGWCEERCLQIERHQHGEEIRIHAECRQHGQEYRHENDQNFRPFQWPPKQEDNDLNEN